MILLTGATGFLGFEIAKALKERQESFLCLIRPNAGKRHKLTALESRFLEIDFNNSAALTESLTGAKCVIHSLGLINGSEEELRAANVSITRSLVQASVKSGVEHFIHVSSVAAIFRHGTYGETKYESEQLVQQSGLPHTLFRPAFIYGEGDERGLGMLIRTLKRLPIIPLLGGGNFALQPVYVQDVVALVMQALERGPSNQAFNVAGPEQITLRSMLEILVGHLGIKRTFVPVPLKPVQSILRILSPLLDQKKLPVKQILELDKHEAFDISTTRKQFSFNPRTFREGVETMFEKKLCAA